MMSATFPSFHVPVRPYSPIDALNRRAAALGSPRYAQLASYADYNGHHVNVWWNDYKQYYIAEYRWAERIVLQRGRIEDCIKAALREYDRGALGASVEVSPNDEAALAYCEAEPRLVKGSLWVQDESGRGRNFREGSWYTWQHQAAAESARDSANPRGRVLIFDWEIMQASSDRADYNARLTAKYGHTYQ